MFVLLVLFCTISLFPLCVILLPKYVKRWTVSSFSSSIIIFEVSNYLRHISILVLHLFILIPYSLQLSFIFVIMLPKSSSLSAIMVISSAKHLYYHTIHFYSSNTFSLSFLVSLQYTD